MANQPVATHMQMFDEKMMALTPAMPIDLAVLVREVGPDGFAEFPFADGVYRSLGHIGNFVMGLQRVRKIAASADQAPSNPEPVMDMARLAVQPDLPPAA